MDLAGKQLGPFRVLHEIGRGGMGIVYKAWHLSLERHVALKVLHPDLQHDPSALARFRREAQTASGLNHPAILRTYDAGRAPVAGGDGQTVHYIAMDYVDGGSLKDWLAPGPLPLHVALEIAIQLARALDYAHRQGVIHRDIKPSNVLLAGGDRQKGGARAFLTDLGIAHAVWDSRLTRTGQSIGTPSYMSPEQAQGRPADARSDVYALGVLLYEMLTGRVPFKADTPASVLQQHIHVAPVPPHHLDPRIPPAMEKIILQSMAKDPMDRYASMAELLHVLKACDQYPASRPPRQAPAREEPRSREEQRGEGALYLRIIGILVVAIVVSLVVVGAIWLGQRSQARDVERSLEEGRRLYGEGQWPEAIERLEQVLALVPGHTEAADLLESARRQQQLLAHFSQGEAAAREGMLALAIEQWRQVYALDAGYQDVAARLFDAHVAYARQLVAADRFPEAIGHLQQALALGPDAGEVQAEHELLVAYQAAAQVLQAGDWDQAVYRLEAVYRQRPDLGRTGEMLYQAYCGRGEVRLAAGELEAASEDFGRALALNPGGTEAREALAKVTALHYQVLVSEGNAYLALRDPDAAQQAFEAALRIDPAGQAALDGLRQVSALRTELLVEEGQALLFACQLEEAELAFQQALDRDPANGAAQQGLAQVAAYRTPYLLTSASAGFSASQGGNHWYYLERDRGGERYMSWRAERGRWEGAAWQEIRLEASGGHPGTVQDVLRRWVAPFEGEVWVRGQAYKVQPGGNGVEVAIYHGGMALWHTVLTGGYAGAAWFDVPVRVSPGSSIDFVIRSLGNTDWDATHFDPEIWALPACEGESSP